MSTAFHKRFFEGSMISLKGIGLVLKEAEYSID
jgi:hypothetical protein